MSDGAPAFTAVEATERAARRATEAAAELERQPAAHERTKRELRGLSAELGEVAALLRGGAR